MPRWHEWFTPRRSGNAQNCVETHLGDETVLVRNSRDRSGPVVVFTHDEWRAFIGSVKESSDYDLPDYP